MRKNTKLRKKASKGFKQISDEDWMRDRMFEVFAEEKRAFDGLMGERQGRNARN